MNAVQPHAFASKIRPKHRWKDGRMVMGIRSPGCLARAVSMTANFVDGAGRTVRSASIATCASCPKT